MHYGCKWFKYRAVCIYNKVFINYSVKTVIMIFDLTNYKLITFPPFSCTI